jgi:hypothetical protein
VQLAVMALADLFYFTTDMWAVIDKETQIVLGALLPDTPLVEVEKASKKYDIVLMTIDNSPASVGDKYEEGKFKRMEN